jgi:hypothetical protein
MAGGALSLAGMGRGGYAPRIYARPELIHDEVFAPSFHQGRGVIGESNLGTRSLGPLGTHRSVAVAGVDLGWCERVAGLLFMPVPQEKAGNRLHPDFHPVDQTAEVERLLSLDARRVDVGQRNPSWVVLADPEGNEFCILGGRVRPDSWEPATEDHSPFPV